MTTRLKGLTLVELMVGLAILGILVGVAAKLKTFQSRYRTRVSTQASIPTATAFLETYLRANYHQIDFNVPLFLFLNASNNWECSTKEIPTYASEPFEVTFKRKAFQDAALSESENYYYLGIHLESLQGPTLLSYPFFYGNTI